MSEEKNYETTESTDISHVAIKLREGIYTGVKFRYGNVNIEEDKENDTCRLQFEYTVEEAPSPLDCSELEELGAFKQYVGDILVDILSDHAAHIGDIDAANAEKQQKTAKMDK